MWLIGSVGTAILMVAPFETTVALDIAIIFSFAAFAFAALAMFTALAAFAVFIATAFPCTAELLAQRVAALHRMVGRGWHLAQRVAMAALFFAPYGLLECWWSAGTACWACVHLRHALHQKIVARRLDQLRFRKTN